MGLAFHKKYSMDVYSQNGEDGVIEEILSRLPPVVGLVVEFGAHDGEFCSNSRHLIVDKGWSGLLIEADWGLYNQCAGLYSHLSPQGPEVKQAFVTPENVNHLLPPKIDVLSIDVDGIDYHIWAAYKGDAKVVIIEINSSLPPDFVMEGDKVRGSSFWSMLLLGMVKGYFLICHCGNMIFVKNEYRDLFKDVPDCLRYSDFPLFFNTSWL